MIYVNDSTTQLYETQQAESGPDMGRAALWYAGQGLAVFPVHEPLFNHPLGYTCTCEEWRHGDWAKKHTPHRYLDAHEHCEGPGKCPRGKWKDESTTDPSTIRHWWRKWPTANIGIDCGKSGLLVLDADTYKEQYDGEKFLTQADEETVTTLTGGGGVHLWYKMPEGKTWGNHNKGLPAGIDIRGAGGYVVAAPSLHKSSKRYAFEAGYELGTIDLLPVPDKLAELLDRAAASFPSRAGVTVHFTETTTERPDLAAWNLSQTTIDKINHPVAARGGRSEVDYSVCLALCYAGLADADILAVFQHYPIGTNGKYSERGPDYLARTVGNARAWMAAHPPTEKDGSGPGTIAAKINALRLRLRSADFAELVPLELQSATGYRTGDRDRVIADTALGYLWELHTLEARISNLELSERTGYSPNTCGAAMKRLVNLFQPIGDEPGKQATRYKINDALLCDTSHKEGINTLSQSSASVLSTHRGHDVFVRSLSALTPEELAERDEKRIAAGGKPMTRNRQLAARLAASERALGPAALRLVDILDMYGELRGVELAALLHKSKTATRRIISRTITAGLVVETETGFALAGGWSQRVNELDAIVPTAGTMERRALAAADSRLRYCESALETAVDRAKRDQLTRRKGRAKNKKWALIQADVQAYNERAQAAGLAGVTIAEALKPGRGETFADWQRRRVMDAQIDELAIRAFAKTLVGLDRQTAEQTAYYAGYSAYEFAQAWAYRGIA